VRRPRECDRLGKITIKLITITIFFKKITKRLTHLAIRMNKNIPAW
jgi:hypothetical protein